MTGYSIAVDAMGGDFGPHVTVPASVQALSYSPSLNITLIGQQSLIEQKLSSLGIEAHPRMTIIDAPHVIGNDMRPSLALRSSHGSSMRMALDLVANNQSQACVSAGNTGALMALSRSLLKLLPEIDRPALVTALPTMDQKKTWLLDLGANVSVDVDTLFKFAVMGSVLAEIRMGYPPRVALLNVGREANKGNDLVKGCAERLKQYPSINFVGFVEGDQLYTGDADVIVCDGFTGNVSLKSSEGAAKFVLGKIKSHFEKQPVKRWLIEQIFGGVVKQLHRLNPDHYNGASLLGLRGIVVKSHGNADEAAFLCAIMEAVHEVERQLPEKICDRLEAILVERHQ